MSDLNEALWARYRINGDTRARALLLDRYLGLVHHSAHQLARRISREIEIDDLIGAGTLGLVQALEGFDEHRGLAFSTYAMPRIRGAMLDELRGQASCATDPGPAVPGIDRAGPCEAIVDRFPNTLTMKLGKKIRWSCRIGHHGRRTVILAR